MKIYWITLLIPFNLIQSKKKKKNRLWITLTYIPPTRPGISCHILSPFELVFNSPEFEPILFHLLQV